MENKAKLSQYIDIIESFLRNEIDALTFETTYLEVFKKDHTLWQDDVFEILNQLFTDLDVFNVDPSLHDEGDLNESELREQAAIAVNGLKALNLQ